MKIHQAKNLRLEESVNRDAEIRRAGKPFPYAMVVAVAVILTGLVGWQVLRSRETVPVDNAALAEEAASPPPAVSGAFTAAGYMEPVPPFPVKITPLVPGRIDEFPVVEGDVVRVGDVIARLNSEGLENRATELQAARAVTNRRLDLAEKELIRARTLSEKGASTLRELDEASADVQILRAESEKILAELASVEWQIENSTIRSPVDGILFERTASVGHFINLEERHEIASVIDPAHLQVWVDINQRDAGQVRPGRPALVSLDAEPGREFRATVERISPKASLAKNTIRCVLTLEETSPALRPDMSVKVTFPKP